MIIDGEEKQIYSEVTTFFNGNDVLFTEKLGNDNSNIILTLNEDCTRIKPTVINRVPRRCKHGSRLPLF